MERLRNDTACCGCHFSSRRLNQAVGGVRASSPSGLVLIPGVPVAFFPTAAGLIRSAHVGDRCSQGGLCTLQATGTPASSQDVSNCTQRSVAKSHELPYGSSYESPWMNAELHAFRSTARKFIHTEFAPRQARWREQRYPDADAWMQAGKAGILLPDIPREFGGGGGTFAHEAVVLEELARAGVYFGASTQNAVAHYIFAYGSEQQKRSWLPRMARGELVGAVAMTEPLAGSDLQSIKTTAHRVGERYVLNGM